MDEAEKRESRKSIKIIQNILKVEGEFDLALKLENSYFKYIYGYASTQVELFVNQNYFLDFKRMSENKTNLLIELFNGLNNDGYKIDEIIYIIDKNIGIEKSDEMLYIFIDESGNRDFTKNGSKYFMFNFLIKKRPFNLHDVISNYRYTLLERNLESSKSGKDRLDIEYFHASRDNKYIKDKMFDFISTFDTSSIKVYSYILEKPKVDPDKRKEIDKFYIDNLTYAIKKLLTILNIDENFIIITDKLPIKKKEKLQAKAIKSAIAKYIEDMQLNIRYDIFHHCSASSVNLQIIDYISWAIFRKFEHKQGEFFEKIEKYIIKIDNVTSNREKKYY